MRSVQRGYLDLTRQLSDPRILSNSPYTKRLFVHQYQVTALDQARRAVRRGLAEAYAVGQGVHLAGLARRRMTPPRRRLLERTLTPRLG